METDALKEIFEKMSFDGQNDKNKKKDEEKYEKVSFSELGLANFEIKKLLGRGSFGEVFLVGNDNENFAMKAIRKDWVYTYHKRVNSLLLERDILLLGSENQFIAQLYFSFQTDEHFFLVMDLLNGGELHQHISINSFTFDEDAVRFYGIEIACGIQFLHRKNIIHCDIKTNNIMLDSRGHCKIVDFGMSKKVDDTNNTINGKWCCTFEYTNSELLRSKSYSFATDWWGFGTILDLMFIQNIPLFTDDIDELCQNIKVKPPSKEASKCIALFFEKDPTKRLGMPTCPAGEIRNQPFFSKLDWDKVTNLEVEPPFKPILKSKADTVYFPEIFTKQQAVLTRTYPINTRNKAENDTKTLVGFNLKNFNYKHY